MEAVDNKFSATVNNYSSIRDELWMAIDDEIQPRDCRIYRFVVPFYFFSKERQSLNAGCGRTAYVNCEGVLPLTPNPWSAEVSISHC